MKGTRKLHPDTQCIHSCLIPEATGSVITPIYQTSTFSFKDADHGARLFAGEEKGYIYTRMTNPTVQAVENAVAVLEGGHKGLGCGSGMAAIHTTFAAMVSAGDHVVCSDAVYGPTNTLLTSVMSRFGIESTFVNTSDLDEVKKASRPETKLYFVETPGNPTLAVTDISAVAGIAHDNGARLAVDNTFMSPLLQQPLKLGADVVIHSMTKFLNGHADVVAGMIIVKEEDDYSVFKKILNQLGGVIDPFNSFLVARGIKTLAVRLDRQCSNTLKIVKYLEEHPKVDEVHFPGLPSHPQYEIACRQMKSPGAMTSFELKGGIEAGRQLMNSVKLHTLAVSLGGVESLIQHPASMTHASMGTEARKKAGIADGLVRLSVGIENADDLLADLEQGLSEV